MPEAIVYPKEYKGKFVARRGNKLLDADEDLERLLGRLKRKGVDVREVVIDYVPAEDEILIV